jgi:hypothetical protein
MSAYPDNVPKRGCGKLTLSGRQTAYRFSRSGRITLDLYREVPGVMKAETRSEWTAGHFGGSGVLRQSDGLALRRRLIETNSFASFTRRISQLRSAVPSGDSP